MTLVYKSPFILEQTCPTHFPKDENEKDPDPMKKNRPDPILYHWKKPQFGNDTGSIFASSTG